MKKPSLCAFFEVVGVPAFCRLSSVFNPVFLNHTSSMMQPATTLKRTLSLPMMILYGLGTTIGAGIYALVGEIAGVAGSYAPVSFLIASLMAGFTALSFAELSARYPYAAGAALYVSKGFAPVRVSTMVGLLVIAGGLVSAAAMINGFVGYLHQFVAVERLAAIVMITLALGGIAAWGIAESVAIAGLITIVEIGGLLLTIAVSRSGLASLPDRWLELVPSLDISSWAGIGAGAMLAFYAFIGFEDMVDVAEEVKEVERNLPAAILWTLGITTLLYLVLMIAAIMALPLADLAGSEAPLARIYQYYTGKDATIISAIGMFAVINGALIQMIMAARVLYGLSSRGQLPALLAMVDPRTHTPLFATALATTIVLALALTGRLASLAEMTSLIMLTVFALVNLALWRIKRKDPHPPMVRVFPFWIPLAGFLVSSAFVLAKVMSWMAP